MSSSSLRDASVETVSSMQPSSTPPRGLLDLAAELLLSILTDSLLSARDVVTFGLTCHEARGVLLLSSDSLWSVLLHALLPRGQAAPSILLQRCPSKCVESTNLHIEWQLQAYGAILECSQLRTVGVLSHGVLRQHSAAPFRSAMPVRQRALPAASNLCSAPPAPVRIVVAEERRLWLDAIIACDALSLTVSWWAVVV